MALKIISLPQICFPETLETFPREEIYFAIVRETIPEEKIFFWGTKIRFPGTIKFIPALLISSPETP